MNRGLSVDKVRGHSNHKPPPTLANARRSLRVDRTQYMAAIMEALEPRMNGQDLHHLESFKTMNPPGDLKEGSEMIMTIKGDTMVYRSR